MQAQEQQMELMEIPEHTDLKQVPQTTQSIMSWQYNAMTPVIYP